MTFLNGWAGGLILMLFAQMAVAKEADVLVGTARSTEGKLLYFERHDIEKDESGFNRFIRVEYKDPEGRVFATMTSDFNKNKLVPESVFEDRRFKTKHVLRLVENTIEFEKLKDGKIAEKKQIPQKDLMVASQGFDNFIRSYSSSLDQGKSFQFGVLSQMDFYSLTGYKRSSPSPDDVEYGIRPSSWFVRLFADELRVVYDAKTKRLKTFAGRSNIPDENGKQQDVVVTYNWESDAK